MESATVRSVRPSTVRHGAQESSHPPVPWLIDTQTWVWAADPAGAHEPTPHSLRYSAGAPGKHCFRQLAVDERDFVKVHISSEEVPAHYWSKKTKPTKQTKNKFGHAGENKRNSFTFPVSSLPSSSTAQDQERFSQPAVSLSVNLRPHE